MGTVDVAEWSVRVHGYVALDGREVARRVAMGRGAELVREAGSFALVAERVGSDETVVVTSAFGTVQYFYATVGSRLFHGPTVGGVVREAGLVFRWDLEAVGTLLALEHLTGTQTLHPEVHRTPPGSVLHFKDGVLRTTVLSWGDLAAGGEEVAARPEAITDALVEEVDRFAGREPVLSASAGFDSRLLLAALLRAGRRPRLMVAGSEASTDRRVTEEMARRYGLEVIPVELRPEDFPPAAEAITLATGGTKPAMHWHTYIYPRRAGLSPETPLFVGANGEFARSYYLNKGIFSRATELLPAKGLALAFWRKKSLLGRTMGAEEYRHLTPGFAEALRRVGAGHAERMWGLHPAETLLEHLDRSYLYERVRHFIGNGLALYALSARPITPFLSVRWVTAVARLGRGWKLGSAYHRRAIQYLEPGLLDFYEEGTRGAMTARPVAFYYRRNKVAPVPLYDRGAVFGHPGFRELLAERAEAIGELADPGWVRGLDAGRQQRLVGMLLPLAIWAGWCRG